MLHICRLAGVSEEDVCLSEPMDSPLGSFGNILWLRHTPVQLQNEGI
jgi:hypothetical protein